MVMPIALCPTKNIYLLDTNNSVNFVTYLLLGDNQGYSCTLQISFRSEMETTQWTLVDSIQAYSIHLTFLCIDEAHSIPTFARGVKSCEFGEL